MSCVGVVGVRKRQRASQVLSDAKLSHLLSRGSSGRDGKQIDCGLSTGAVCSVEDRPEEGGVHDHPNACSKIGRLRRGSSGRFQGAAGPPRRSPAASGRVTLDCEVYAAWVEAVHSG